MVLLRGLPVHCQVFTLRSFFLGTTQLVVTDVDMPVFRSIVHSTHSSDGTTDESMTVCPATVWKPSGYRRIAECARIIVVEMYDRLSGGSGSGVGGLPAPHQGCPGKLWRAVRLMRYNHSNTASEVVKQLIVKFGETVLQIVRFG